MSNSSNQTELDISYYYTPQENPYGKSFGEWTVSWWNWAYSAPKFYSPIYDASGRNAHVNQQGPVWFLAGTFGENKIVYRTCTIPYGKAILFPVINYEINRMEKPTLKTNSDLINDVITDINDIVKKDVIVDGKLTPSYRIQSVPHTFPLKIVDGIDNDLKSGIYETAADGYWVFLKPLPFGEHTIYFHGSCAGGTRNSTAQYVISIK